MRVLIIDDSPVFLRAAASLLAASRPAPFVVLASAGEEGVARASEIQPDLVLVDAVMPGIDGFETAQRLKALPRPPRVFVVSLNDEPAYRLAASHAGADGFLSKADLPQAMPALLLAGAERLDG